MLMDVMQVLVLALVAWVFFRGHLKGTAWYCSLWFVGVVAIRYRYGTTEELVFYSNDQRHHAVVANALVELGLRSDWGYMIRSGRIAYTLPAAFIQGIGFNTAIALKFISLISFLLTATIVVKYLQNLGVVDRVLGRYLTLFGPAGLFFSVLALRETTMLLLVTMFFVFASPRARIVALAAVASLRPHLAVALLVGVMFAPLAMMIGKRFYYLAIAMALLIPATLGNAGYAAGIWLIDGVQFELTRSTISAEAFQRILTNLIGLQFLSSDATTTTLNFADLMLARVPFLETILIPFFFTATLLLVPRLTALRWQVFASFSFYLGLVTVTDFNSFRQNVPFMAVFGLVTIAEGITHLSGETRHASGSTNRSLMGL